MKAYPGKEFFPRQIFWHEVVWNYTSCFELTLCQNLEKNLKSARCTITITQKKYIKLWIQGKFLKVWKKVVRSKKRGKGTQRLHFLAFCGKLQPCWLLQTLNNFCYNEKCHHKLPDKYEEKRNSYSSSFSLYTGPTVVFSWCQRVNSLRWIWPEYD